MTLPAKSLPYALRYACVCDRGLRREGNQDRAWADLEHRVFAVCDGVGGNQGGEIASQTAIETLQDAFQTPDDNPPPVRLERAVHYANRDIYEMALHDIHLSGMATTVVALLLDGVTAHVAHAGDSRLYRFHDGRLVQETLDHTDLMDTVRRGELTLDEALRLPGVSRNVINRALGTQHDVELETRSFPFEPGTRFLLCSDGVTRHIPNDELAAVLASAADPQAACDALHERCYERGAEDNLTALVVWVDRAGEPVPVVARPVEPVRVSGDLQRRREATIPPRSFPPERTSGEHHPFREHLEAHRSTVRRRVLLGGLAGLMLLAAAFWAGGRYWKPVAAIWTTPSTTSPVSQTETNRELFESARRDLTAGDDVKASEERFRRLADREPTRADYRYWLGRAVLAAGRPAEAVPHFQAAVTLDPSLADAYLFLAGAKAASGDRTGAETALKRYSEIVKK